MKQSNKPAEKPDQREWRMKKGLDAFGNMFGLNVCFVIACLPVITIGASLSATYAMAIRLQEGEEETILHGFIHEFKRSFKQATIAWLLVLVAGAILWAENVLINNDFTTPGITIFYTIIFYLELLLVALTLAFLFPMIGRYNTTIKLAFKNSLLLSVGYVWSAIKIIVAWWAPIILSIVYPMIFIYTWYLWLLLLFGVIIWGTSHTIRKVFKRNEEALDATSEKKKEEAAEAEEKAKRIEEKRKKLGSDLPPKKQLTGIASKANVLKAENQKNQQQSKPSTGNANNKNPNKNSSSKSTQNGGWYRGDKYNNKGNKNKKK
jgi:uncharacterized membrane protein YesL